MTEPSEVDRAKAAEAKARIALMETIGRIQSRIAPSSVMHETIEKARNRGEAIVQRAVRGARAHPGRAAAIAGVVVATLARKPLARLARRLFSRAGATPPADAG